jgi:hypothetical protein
VSLGSSLTLFNRHFQFSVHPFTLHSFTEHWIEWFLLSSVLAPLMITRIECADEVFCDFHDAFLFCEFWICYFGEEGRVFSPVC